MQSFTLLTYLFILVNICSDMRLSSSKIDSLWYCLCPSFYSYRVQAPKKCFYLYKNVSRRQLSSGPWTSLTGASTVGRREHKSPRSQSTRPHSKCSSFHSPDDLGNLSVGDLESLLEQSTSRRRIDAPRIASILKTLLQNHCVTPTTRHYKAYLLANIDRQHGSPENVRKLLWEMESRGITADSATLHAALEVLSVHPDYILRQEVLEALRVRWLSLSPAGWHHVVAGLLREGQFELALDRLDQMERKGIPLEQWLHSLLVYKLFDAAEFGEALRLLRSRPNKSKSISSTMWLYLLRVGIASRHYETVKYVWSNTVDLGYKNLNISDCRDVLAFASSSGDVDFTECVFRHLSCLEKHLNSADYGHLLHVYARHAEFHFIMRIICEMHGSGIPVDIASIQEILQAMQTKMVDPAMTWSEVCAMKSEIRKIPLVLANLVLHHIEFMFKRGSLDEVRAVDIATSIYKDIFDVCPSGVDTETFNALISLCRSAKRPDICTFYVQEMAALNVPPDQKTLEHLVLICLDSGNRSSASKYLADLRSHRWDLSPSARAQIITNWDLKI